MTTKKEFIEMAEAMRDGLDIPCRVKAFNTLVPVLKKFNPRFSVTLFYDSCFLLDSPKAVKWDEGRERAVKQ